MRPVKPADRHEVSARTRLGVAAAALAVLCAAGVCHAGPWTRPRGGHYTKIAASYLYTDTEFDHDGAEVPLLTANPLVRSAAYREVALSAYVEYGIRDRWTVVGALPFKILTSRRTEITELADLIREVDVTNAGWSDLSLGVRRALATGSRPVAVEVVGTAPLGYDAAPDNGGPALGSGHADLAVTLAAGLSARGAYATISGTYRVRGGPLADETGVALQAGASRGRVSGQALLEGRYATADPGPLDVSSTVAVANQDVIKVIASLGWQMARGAAVVAEAYHVLRGRNTATGTTGAVALVLTK